MTRNPLIDPQPPSEPWKDRSLTAEELAALRDRLSKMTQANLVQFYEAGLQTCRLNHGEPPRAPFIQQLVASWKELRRRRRGKT